MERREFKNKLREKADIPDVVEEKVSKALRLIHEKKGERGEESDREVIELQRWEKKTKEKIMAACMIMLLIFGITIWNWDTVKGVAKSFLVHQSVITNDEKVNLKLGYLTVKWPDASEIDPNCGMVKVQSLKKLSQKLEITVLDSDKLKKDHAECSIGLPYDRGGIELTDQGQKYVDEMISVLGPVYRLGNDNKDQKLLNLTLTMYGKRESTKKKMKYIETICGQLVKTGYDKTFGKYYIFSESDKTDGSVKGIFQFQNVRYELMGNVSETEMENAITSFRIKYIQ